MFFTDTGSLTYEIECGDVYEKFFKHKHLLDFSKNQPKCYDPTNKIIIGKMRDEFKGKPVCKYVGLRSKLYSIMTGYREINKAKGVNVSIEFEKYCDKREQREHKINCINLVHMKFKKCISCFDDKRYILDNGLIALACFHKETKILTNSKRF